MCHYDIHNSLIMIHSCKIQWSATTLNSDQITNRIIKLHIVHAYNQFALYLCV